MQYLNKNNITFTLFLTYFVLIPISLYQYNLGNMPNLVSLLNLYVIVISLFLLRYLKINLLDLMIIFIFIFMLINIQIDLFMYSKNEYLYDKNIKNLIFSISLYSMGRFFVYQKNNFILFLFLFILIVEKILNLNTDFLSINLDFEDEGIYLFLADTFSIVALLAISVCRNFIVKIILIIASFYILFIMGSRAAFYIFTLVIIINLLKESRFLYVVLFLCFLVFITNYFLEKNNIKIDIENSRMISVLIDVEKDRSQIARKIQINQGFNEILNNPILGSYGGQIIRFNSFGSYMHNIFSYYRQFGLIVFLGIIFGLIFISICYYQWLFNGKYKNFNYIFYIGTYIILIVMFFRAYTAAYFWFMLGLFFSLKK